MIDAKINQNLLIPPVPPQPEARPQNVFWTSGIKLLLLIYCLGGLSLCFTVLRSGSITLNLPLSAHPLLRGAFEFQLDSLSVLLMTMASLLGVVIAQYADRYLEGEAKKGYFYRWLFLTLSSVGVLLASGHLLTLLLAWISTSLCLNQLLVFYRSRPQAQKAAFKKFAVSRLGDLFLILGILFIYHQFETLELQQIFKSIENLKASSTSVPLSLRMSALFFALGAMTKSAQFPFHFWLPETMETPTPVSALMHAGIINAGGFLLIRLNPILQLEPLAGILLTLIGGLTAVFGSLVMITQNDIKKKLAYSTISQMGVMIGACGLGAYSLALFHMIMHSFYKAYAFLSTGTLVEESRKISHRPQRNTSRTYFMTALFGISILVFGSLFAEGKYLALFTYSSILALGFIQNRGLLLKAHPSLHPLQLKLTLAIKISLAASSSFLLEYYLSQQISPLIASTQSLLPYELSALTWNLLCLIFFTLFYVNLILSSELIHSEHPLLRRLYFYLWNGGYLSYATDALFDLNRKAYPQISLPQAQDLSTQEQNYA